MSTQSIIIQDRQKHAYDVEEKILWNADRYVMDKRFRLGGGINYKEALFYSKIGGIICTQNCELSKWIEDKIKGILEDCGKKTKDKTITDLLQMIPQTGGTQTDSLNNVMRWEDVAW